MKNIFELFKQSSLKAKMMTVTMLTTFVALLFICTAFILYDIANIKQATTSELSLLAEIIGKRTAPAMQFFGDEDQIQKNLLDLTHKDSVVLACIYQLDNTIIAKYSNFNVYHECPKQFKEGNTFGNNYFAIGTHIHTLDDERIGGIYVLSTTADIKKHIIYAVSGATIIALVIFAFVYLLSDRFYSFIYKPISELTQVATKITQKKDYQLYAKKIYDDEIGMLTDVFNKMTKNVQSSTENLELQVKNRTMDLEKSLSVAEKERDRAEKADLHKSEWLRNMSHEFRTPIHGLLSFATYGEKESLNEDVPRKKLHHYFTRIMSCTDRLQYLVNGILDLAVAESGRMTLTFSSQCIMTLTEDISEQLSGILRDKELTVKIKKPKFSTILSMDVDKINQVITNLMGNAIKFSPKGTTITITCEQSKIKKRNGKFTKAIRYSMSDKGPGIPKSELKEIFEVFKQSSATNDQAGGTGLGLSISSHIIKAHGGKIWAENNPTKGAIISFVLPVDSVNKDN